MPAIAIDAPRLSSVVVHEYEASTEYCREVVVVNEGSALSYPVGTVLGKVTATGKYKRVEASATDGSEVAAAIYISGINGNYNTSAIAATTDTKAIVIARGAAIVSKGGLVFGASVNSTPLLNAAYAQLEAKGIVCRETLGSYPVIA